MKNLIIGIAIILTILTFNVYQMDINDMEVHQNALKFATDQATNSAMLELDEQSYGDGYITFDYAAGVRSAFEVIQKETGVRDDFSASGEYYTEPMDMYVYFFDSSMVAKKYHNNVYIESFAFEWGDLVGDTTDITTLTEENFTITRPSVVTIVDAGEPRMRLPFLQDRAKIMKMSVYEYDTPH